MTRILAAVALAGLIVLPAQAQKKMEWGTITGKVVWGEKDAPPKNKEATLAGPDQKYCQSKGKVLENKLIVDAKTKGVRNVAVWLVDAKNPAAKIPVHPALAKSLPKTVEIDQPCCEFVPRIVPVVDGQELVVLNNADIAHNCNIGGKVKENFLMPKKTKREVGKLAWDDAPFQFTCNIHAWMKGWIVTVPTPYFTLTKADGTFTIKDAPVGKWKLLVWHEETGWVTMEGDDTGPKSKPVEVEAGKTTDTGTIKFLR